MWHRKKNKNALSRFLKYTGGVMKGKERNSFERGLQRDPFEAEAAEGLSMVTPGEAVKDLHDIERRLSEGKKRRVLFTPLRIAASVTIIAGISAMLLFLRKTPGETLVSQNIPAEKVITIPEAKTITRQPSPVVEKNAVPVNNITGAVDTNETGYNAVSELIATDMPLVTTLRDSTGLLAASPDEIAEALQGRVAGISVMGASQRSIKPRDRIISGTVISNDDKQPLPGVAVVVKGTSKGAVTDAEGRFSIDAGTDSSLVLVANFVGMESEEIKSKTDTSVLIAMNENKQALEEVIVVGYGIARKEKGAENTPDYVPAQPSEGYSQFREYIKSNMRYPENGATKERQVVVVGATVKTDGTLTALRIIRSPSQAFSDEALRLIREGPSWKAATLSGNTIEEEVRIRIVFKAD